MVKVVEKTGRWWAAAVVAIAIGCSSKLRNEVTTTQQSLATSNGVSQNGLTTNGLWVNGLWVNGLWVNGLWVNGLWVNGLWVNGLWVNGLWVNGLWVNGLSESSHWQEGLWADSTWSKALTGDAAIPGDGLRGSPNARILLQYIYACAMPPLTYDTSLDPNGGELRCSQTNPCTDGYSCVPDTATTSSGKCVIPLRGSIGVGINKDATSWGESGRCDESCQRWVSACVLARTNAYGVHVEISMRAPANSPPGQENQFDRIRAALQTTQEERAAFGTREGAYYGNLFKTTPGTLDVNNAFVPDYVTKHMSTGASIGTVDQYQQFTLGLPENPQHADGKAAVVMATPTFSACAGPGSNVPEITNRFCSSQGDQVVINVPGVCLPDDNPTHKHACAADDGNPDGAMHDCFTNTDPTQRTAADEYNEVITVFLKTRVPACGNQVCEPGETTTSCNNDCPEGIWTKDFDASYGFGGRIVDATSGETAFARGEMSAVTPPRFPGDDDGVVVVGKTINDVDLGGGNLPEIDGDGVLAKYEQVHGGYRWSHRFRPSATPATNTITGQPYDWDVSGGVTVAANGEISVVGTMVEMVCKAADTTCIDTPETSIWVNTYSPDGDLMRAYTVPIGANPLSHTGGSASPLTHVNDVTLTRAVAAEPDGSIVLAAGYCGSFAIQRTNPLSNESGVYSTTFDLQTQNCTPAAYSGEGPLLGTPLFGFGTFVAKLSPPPAGSRGTALWVRSLADGAGGLTPDGAVDLNLAGFSALSLAIDGFTDDVVLLTGGRGARLTKLRGVDGSDGWTKFADADGGQKEFSVVTVDKSDARLTRYGYDVYVGGYFGTGAGFGCPQEPVEPIQGLPPFLMRLHGNGDCVWLKYGNTVCPPPLASASTTTPPPNCGGSFSQSSRSQVEGMRIGFDPSGNVILGSFGNPVPGGGIDFRTGPLDKTVGTFPTYTSRNIFLSTYNPIDGRLIWAKQIPTILSSFLLGMESDSRGRIVVSGNYSGSMEVLGHLFVTGVPEQPDVINSFLASFNPPSLSDTAAPTIGEIPASQDTPAVTTLPKHIVVPATSADGAKVYFIIPTAIDEGNSGSNVSCYPPPNSTFQIGDTDVICTASDAVGNQTTDTFTVSVTDKVGPVFLPYADVEVPATRPNGANVAYAVDDASLPAAIDQVDGRIKPVCVPASGTLFPVGKTKVTCTATDTRGNQSTASFNVTVQGVPVGVTCASASDCLSGFCADGVCCADACGGGNPGDCRACSIAAGGSAMGACTAVVAGRICRPSAGVCDVAETCDGANLTCPPDRFVVAGSECRAASNACEAAGMCSGFAATCLAPAPIPGCGPPVVMVSVNLTVEATSSTGANVTFSATAKDWRGTALTPTCTPPSGSHFAIGTKTVVCTAMDASNQVGSASFNVTVRDSAGPVFCDVPGTIKAFATNKSGAKVTYPLPHANDAIDGARLVNCTLASGAQFPVNKTTVLCTAADKSGNISTAKFDVVVTYQAPTDGTFFLLPVRSDGSSVFRIGRPVPARFKLTGASAGITDLVAKLTVTKLSNTIQGTALDASDEVVDDTGFLFKYRSALKVYAYGWKTRGESQGTYRLTADLDDGVVHQINVSLKRP